jgi:hypothetical protein
MADKEVLAGVAFHAGWAVDAVAANQQASSKKDEGIGDEG